MENQQNYRFLKKTFFSRGLMTGLMLVVLAACSSNQGDDRSSQFAEIAEPRSLDTELKESREEINRGMIRADDILEIADDILEMDDISNVSDQIPPVTDSGASPDKLDTNPVPSIVKSDGTSTPIVKSSGNSASAIVKSSGNSSPEIVSSSDNSAPATLKPNNDSTPSISAKPSISEESKKPTIFDMASGGPLTLDSQNFYLLYEKLQARFWLTNARELSARHLQKIYFGKPGTANNRIQLFPIRRTGTGDSFSETDSFEVPNGRVTIRQHPVMDAFVYPRKVLPLSSDTDFVLRTWPNDNAEETGIRFTTLVKSGTESRFPRFYIFHEEEVSGTLWWLIGRSQRLLDRTQTDLKGMLGWVPASYFIDWSSDKGFKFELKNKAKPSMLFFLHEDDLKQCLNGPRSSCKAVEQPASILKLKKLNDNRVQYLPVLKEKQVGGRSYHQVAYLANNQDNFHIGWVLNDFGKSSKSLTSHSLVSLEIRNSCQLSLKEDFREKIRQLKKERPITLQDIKQLFYDYLGINDPILKTPENSISELLVTQNLNGCVIDFFQRNFGLSFDSTGFVSNESRFQGDSRGLSKQVDRITKKIGRFPFLSDGMPIDSDGTTDTIVLNGPIWDKETWIPTKVIP